MIVFEYYKMLCGCSVMVYERICIHINMHKNKTIKDKYFQTIFLSGAFLHYRTFPTRT